MSKLITLVGVVLLLAGSACAEQKIIFNLESIYFGQGTGDLICSGACKEKYTDIIEDYLEKGWRVITATPKEIVRFEYRRIGESQQGCTCIGTNYVIERGKSKRK